MSGLICGTAFRVLKMIRAKRAKFYEPLLKDDLLCRLWRLTLRLTDGARFPLDALWPIRI